MLTKNSLRLFGPHQPRISLAEKLRSGFAGGIAILLLGWILHHLPPLHYPILMLGSIAASAVLLFAAPHTPMAQPWNLVVGHLVSGLAGWSCSLVVSDPLLATGVAVGAAILLMYLLDALHPPGAATALTMVLNSTQYHDMGMFWSILIVVANAGFALLLAIAINNLLPHRRYPVPQNTVPPALKPATIANIEQADMTWALAQMEGMIDIGEDDLTKIYALALSRSQHRNERKPA